MMKYLNTSIFCGSLFCSSAVPCSAVLRFKISIPLFPIPYSQFPIPHSLSSIPQSPFSIPHSPFSILYSPFPILYSPFPIPHSPFPIPLTPITTLSPWHRRNCKTCTFLLSPYCMLLEYFCGLKRLIQA